MEHNNARETRQPEQLSLFGTTGETLLEISVPADTTEKDVRDIGSALVTLTRYHASKVEAQS